MRTDIAIEKLCNVTPYIAELTEGLASDEEYKAYMKNVGAQTKNSTFILRLIPIILKEPHRELVFAILAGWNDKSVEDIKAQPLGRTIGEIKAIFADEDFKSFFSSSSESEETAEKL